MGTILPQEMKQMCVVPNVDTLFLNFRDEYCI